MRLFTSLLLLFVFMHCSSLGCMCVRGITTKYSYHKAGIVVHATIIESKDLSETTITADNRQTIALKGVEYKALVLQQYKGTKLTDTITINPGPGSCEMPFHIGDNYLIFATLETDNTYSTSMCMGNNIYNYKDHRTLLKLQRRNNK